MKPTQRKTKAANELQSNGQEKKPFASVVVPAYNEEAIVEENLGKICQFMNSIEDEYDWELIFVDDGSTDGTGEKADSFAKGKDNVHVLHHIVNFNLGQILKNRMANPFEFKSGLATGSLSLITLALWFLGVVRWF